MKALYHGAPMVLVPWGRDQLGVAARAEALGVAAVVQPDACSDGSVARAVRQVLDDARYEDAVTAACAQIELLGSRTARLE